MTDDNNLYAVGDTAQARNSLVLLDMVEIQFLLQGDIVSLLPVSQMLPSPDDCACGSLEFEGELLPVFYVNRNLQLQTMADSRCTALVILSTGLQRFGLACLGVEKQSGAVPAFYSVPVCMSSRKQPFNEFAIINHKAIGLTSAAELLRVLHLRGANIVSQQPSQRQSIFQ